MLPLKIPYFGHRRPSPSHMFSFGFCVTRTLRCFFNYVVTENYVQRTASEAFTWYFRSTEDIEKKNTRQSCLDDGPNFTFGPCLNTRLIPRLFQVAISTFISAIHGLFTLTNINIYWIGADFDTQDWKIQYVIPLTGRYSSTALLYEHCWPESYGQSTSKFGFAVTKMRVTSMRCYFSAHTFGFGLHV